MSPPSYQANDPEVFASRTTRRQLIKKFNIQFRGPATVDSISRLPPALRKICTDVRELGRTSFATYQELSSRESGERPWRSDISTRAKRITREAKNCLENDANETTWRTNVEHEVLNRLHVEAICRTCHNRLWRPEKSPGLERAVDGHATPSKALDQQERPCTCNINYSRNDIDIVFENKADEYINYPSEVREHINRERPDRIYGLRETYRFELYLDYMSQEMKRNLTLTPFKSTNRALLYPFLVLEAKSEKSADGFLDIELQTAFAIRELLRIQHELNVTSNERGDWDGWPLVWFLSNKGEQWRVHVAHIHTSSGTQIYRVFRLWDGCVDCEERALQLVLILDYVVAWARKYREAVVMYLKRLTQQIPDRFDRDTASMLSTLPAESVRTTTIHGLPHQEQVLNNGSNTALSITKIEDSVKEIEMIDIDSTEDGRQPTDRNTTDLAVLHETEDDSEDDCAILDPCHHFDNEFGVIRDIRCSRNKFFAVIITSANLQTLIWSHSWAHPSLKTLIQSIVDSKLYKMSKEVLDSLEILWTGKRRQKSSSKEDTKVYYVASCFNAHFSESWEQIRELSLIAIAEDAIEQIIFWMEITPNSTLENTPTLSTTTAFQKLLHPCASELFSQCRNNIYLDSKRVQNDVLPDMSETERALEVWPCLASLEEPGIRQQIFSVYNFLVVQQSWTAESFVRFSSAPRRLESDFWFQDQDEEYRNFYGRRFSAENNITDPVAVCLSLESKSPRLCIFLLQPVENSNLDTFALTSYLKCRFTYGPGGVQIEERDVIEDLRKTMAAYFLCLSQQLAVSATLFDNDIVSLGLIREALERTDISNYGLSYADLRQRRAFKGQSSTGDDVLDMCRSTRVSQQAILYS